MYKLEFYFNKTHIKTVEIPLNERYFIPVEDDIIRLDYKKYRVLGTIINYDIHVIEVIIDDSEFNH